MIKIVNFICIFCNAIKKPTNNPCFNQVIKVYLMYIEKNIPAYASNCFKPYKNAEEVGRIKTCSILYFHENRV